MTELRKNQGPPTDDEGRRIIESELTISASSFHTNMPVYMAGESVPTYGGVILRFEELESRRVVFSTEMSVTQWMRLQSQALGVGGGGLRTAARCTLEHAPSSVVVQDPPAEDPERHYVKLGNNLRESLNKALAEYEEAVDDLEALHSEKAGRAAMAEGIRACRTAISRAVANVSYANRMLQEHVNECLNVMLVDERFAASQRETA